MERLRLAGEFVFIAGLIVAGLLLLPAFCIAQACKGDPLWFWPRYARRKPEPCRGGYWDHP